MTNQQLIDTFDATSADQQPFLFGSRFDIHYARQCRKDGTEGIWTHYDQQGRGYRFESDGESQFLSYGIPKNITKEHNRDLSDDHRHPLPDDVLVLSDKNGVSTRVRVTSSDIKSYRQKCGICMYSVVK